MKLLDRVGFVLVLSAGALVLAEDYFELPLLLSMAMVSVGFVACIGGIRGILRGEVHGGFYGIFYRERHKGTSSLLIGSILLVIGFIVIGMSLTDIFYPGGASTFLAELAGTPYGLAVLLGMAGLLVAGFGIVRIMSGSARTTGPFDRHVEFGFRAAGVVSVIAGMIMMLIALALLLAPGLLKGLFDQAVRSVKVLK